MEMDMLLLHCKKRTHQEVKLRFFLKVLATSFPSPFNHRSAPARALPLLPPTNSPSVAQQQTILHQTSLTKVTKHRYDWNKIVRVANFFNDILCPTVGRVQTFR